MADSPMSPVFPAVRSEAVALTALDVLNSGQMAVLLPVDSRASPPVHPAAGASEGIVAAKPGDSGDEVLIGGDLSDDRRKRPRRPHRRLWRGQWSEARDGSRRSIRGGISGFRRSPNGGRFLSAHRHIRPLPYSIQGCASKSVAPFSKKSRKSGTPARQEDHLAWIKRRAVGS